MPDSNTTKTVLDHCETLCDLLTKRAETRPRGRFYTHVPTQKNAKYIHIKFDDPSRCWGWWGKVHKNTGIVKGEQSVKYNLLDAKSREYLFDHADPYGGCFYRRERHRNYKRKAEDVESVSPSKRAKQMSGANFD